MNETAYAKINLALHVRRRRDDGYHELETLFAFVDVGDQLSVSPATRDELRTFGEFGGALTDPFDNIVMKALSALPSPQGGAGTLGKNVRVAAGLGGHGMIMQWMNTRVKASREGMVESGLRTGARGGTATTRCTSFGLTWSGRTRAFSPDDQRHFASSGHPGRAALIPEVLAGVPPGLRSQRAYEPQALRLMDSRGTVSLASDQRYRTKPTWQCHERFQHGIPEVALDLVP